MPRRFLPRQHLDEAMGKRFEWLAHVEKEKPRRRGDE